LGYAIKLLSVCPPDKERWLEEGIYSMCFHALYLTVVRPLFVRPNLTAALTEDTEKTYDMAIFEPTGSDRFPRVVALCDEVFDYGKSAEGSIATP
jgi:hypothetical protein